MTDDRENRLKGPAASGDMDGLEEAWLEALEDPGPAEAFLEALDALAEKIREERSLSLLPLVLEIYEGLDRHEDALAIVRRLVAYRPREPAFRRALVSHIQGAYQGTDWVEGFLRASGLPAAVPLDEGLRKFDSFARYKPGAGVLHKSGWGAGVIEGFNEVTGDLKVRFQDGIVRELPLESAVEALPPLEPDDLRVLLMTDPEALKELALKEPALVIRKALLLVPGARMTAANIKVALLDKAVPAATWSRWWPMAKKAAAQDPLLKVEGGSRPVFTLRDQPVSLEEEALSRVTASGSIPEITTRVREYLAAKPCKELKEQLLAEVQKRVEAGLESGTAPAELLDGVLLLEEQGVKTPLSSRNLLREGLGAGSGNGELARLIASIATEKGRLLALHALPEVFPEDWPGRVAAAYAMLPKNLLDPAADLLIRKGGIVLLLEEFFTLMASPWKAPWPIFYLSRRFTSGAFEGVQGAPRAPEVALAILKCMESPLFHTTGTVLERREIMKRYEEILFDKKRRLFERLMEEGRKEEIFRAYSMVNITSKLPESIQMELQNEVTFRYPELKQEQEKAFWEEEVTYSTRAGIAKKEEELRFITDEKLPEISAAIGRAADFGDLSENAEWTAALEEQRLYTEKAAQIEEDLRDARILEDQTMPEGVVAPGDRVTIQKEGEEGTTTFTLLGPWDVGPAGIVSYKAPIALSLLGKKEGDRVHLELPGTSYDAVIVKVELADIADL